MALAINSYTGRIYPDSFSERWTKKVWALNLLPLGGIACVAYEVGSTCLNARNRTTKLSRDFFKSPVQTTLRKIAQCLWVPIVICGALKLISFIVTACWNRCFPPAPKQDPVMALAEDVIHIIFSYLDLHELATTRLVKKAWNEVLSKPICWQKAIYEEFAFSSKNWARWDPEIVRDVDFSQEHLTLPKEIVEQLRLSYGAFRGKSIMQTHVLVRMPAGFTVNKLGGLAKKYFPNNTHGYMSIQEDIVNEFGDKSSGHEPVWLLMTRDVLEGSRSKSYAQQQDIVANLGQGQVGYEVPTTLEAATCVLAEYVKSNFNMRLLSD